MNATKAYSTMPQSTAPVAEAGVGAFTVQMSLAQGKVWLVFLGGGRGVQSILLSFPSNFAWSFTSDVTYTQFYSDWDYPVVTYLRQPLFFEVALTTLGDPNVELIIDNCWATLNKDRASKPRWDTIVDW